MTIIDQLDQTVTTAVLCDNNNVAHVSLLEQFYAIFIARLAQPDVYTQLLHTEQDISVPATLSSEVSSVTMFEQLWQKASLRQWLIDELATSHHVDTQTTEKLLINATSLIYQELNILANGQFLPAFLQAQQLSIRSYLPVWAEKVIGPKEAVNDAIKLNKNTLIDADNASDVTDDVVKSNATSAPPTIAKPTIDISNIPHSSSDDSAPNNTTTLDNQTLLVDMADTIYANPSEYRDPDTTKSRLKGRTRNPKDNLLVKVLLFIGTLTAIGLAWVLIIKPNYLTPAPVEPVVTPSAAVEPTSEPAVETLSPVELLLALDDSGNIYNCTATVGDTALQKALKQTLNVSFGEQASTCELEVKSGVAKRLSNIDIEALPRVFMLLRSVPFARLQLQNATLSVEAPDGILLQRLLTDIRTIIPTATIISAAPLSSTNSDEIVVNNDDDISIMNNRDNQFVNENMPLDNTYDDTYLRNNVPKNNIPENSDLQNNDMSFNQNAQQSSDVTDNTIEAIPYNSNANRDVNSQPNNNRSFTTSAGSISAAEVDDLASTTIVAEKLRNERPVDKDLIQDK
ncbi:hypothetical protein [uncultured Psychrobacter sp.]|uniref:hypothetical protein n=1 Tax=uncultured Psychrobacter sp. TaxID=259303 RepID=UPI00262CC978|nr:hypothetical protein [uncultured Psychrobacter sp.]